MNESIHLFSPPVRRPQPQRPQFGGGGAAPVTAVFTQQPGGVQPRMSQEGKPQQTAAFGTCSMPGCPFPKRIDGDRVHNYCSRTCAQKHRDVQASSSGYQQKVVTLLQYGMLAHFMNTWDSPLYFFFFFFFFFLLDSIYSFSWTWDTILLITPARRSTTHKSTPGLQDKDL